MSRPGSAHSWGTVAMNNRLNTFLAAFAGIAAGAAAMYYLDPVSGRRRRALVRDKAVAAGHKAVYLAEAKGKRVADRLKGYVVTRRFDRQTPHQPESDQQLHERIRSRIGHVVSHPRSVEIKVESGYVRLGGHIFTRELDRLLSEVKCMAGVRSVDNRLTCHDSAAGIPELQGHTRPSVSEPRPAESSVH